MIVVLLLLLLITAIFSLVMTAFLVLWLRDLVVVRVPYVPVRAHAIWHIVDMLGLERGSRFYDLGCGNAQVLLHAQALRPGITCIGIERGILPYLYALFKTRGKPITITYGDFFSADISSATHIFCYLYPDVMERLGPKFVHECSPDCRVVSCDFPLPGLVPSEVRDVRAGRDPLARTLYLYTGLNVKA